MPTTTRLRSRPQHGTPHSLRHSRAMSLPIHRTANIWPATPRAMTRLLHKSRSQISSKDLYFGSRLPRTFVRCVMSKADSFAPPPKIFSHLILVDEVPEQGLDVTLSADAPTRQALAKADGLVDLAMLDADFHVARQGLSSFNVTGTVRAKITQTC